MSMDLASFSATTAYIAQVGGMDRATMQNLNNPTANPLNMSQLSQLGDINKAIKDGTFDRMAAEDAKKKAEKEAKADKKDQLQEKLVTLLEELVAQGESSSDSDTAKKKKTAAAAAALDFGILDDEEETTSNYRPFEATA